MIIVIIYVCEYPNLITPINYIRKYLTYDFNWFFYDISFM